MRRRGLRQKTAGFSLAEVLIAMLVTLIALLPLMASVLMSLQLAQHSTGATQAASLARQEIEIMKAGDFPDTSSLPLVTTVQRGNYIAERTITDASSVYPHCVALEVKVYLKGQDPDKPLAKMKTYWAPGGP